MKIQRLFFLSISFIFLVNLVNATPICETYDDFSSGSLNTDKWEIRQDVEGHSLTNEYGIDTNLQNFHIQQNIAGDGATFLFPRRQFTTGDIFEYDVDLISKEGSYMQMDLLTGDQYIRVGIFGWWSNSVQGYDELDVSHIKIEFQENNFHLERTTPSNVILIDNLPLTNANGNYQLYIGGGTGNNGFVHLDYDNFELCTEPPQPTLEERLIELEDRVEKLESRVSFLENLVNKIKEFIKHLPKGLRKNWN